MLRNEQVMRHMVHRSTSYNLESVRVPLMHVVCYSNTKRYVMQFLHLHLLCAECVHRSPLNKQQNTRSMTPSSHKRMADGIATIQLIFQPRNSVLVQNAHNLGSGGC